MLTIRPVVESDVSLLLSLANECPPLDIHTPYTYWVLCHLFKAGCFIALENERPIGFITSVVEGKRSLLWQVGVIESHRGQGVAQHLINSVVIYAKRLHLLAVEVSIDPNNINSKSTFLSYTKMHNLSFDQIGTVELKDDASKFYEFENLYMIGLEPS